MVVNGSGFRSGDEFGIGGVGTAIAQIGLDRVMHQIGFLRHHPNRFPQRFQRDMLDVVAVNRDLPAVGVVEARKEVSQSRLARARRSYQGDELSRRGFKSDVVQRRRDLLRPITEEDVLKSDRAANLGGRKRNSIRGVP